MPLRKSTGSVAKKMRLCGVSCSINQASKKLRTIAAKGQRGVGRVDAQPGAIGALQFDLDSARGLWPSGVLAFRQSPVTRGPLPRSSLGVMAICFLRSFGANLKCWATRLWGRTLAKATA